VALIENNPLKAPIIASMKMCTIVSGKNHTTLSTLSLLQRDDGKTTGLKLLSPAGNESGRTQDQGLERVILDETDGLESLAETHIIGQNAASTDVCTHGFTV
jgi:hypothetical protein